MSWEPYIMKVPCNGCTACCRNNQAVLLFPEVGDDPKLFEHEEIKGEDGESFFVLLRRENGDCIYLGANGCTIHDRVPAVCRAFDCRQYFLGMSRDQRRYLSGAKLEILKEARSRLATLSAAERSAAMRRRLAKQRSERP